MPHLTTTELAAELSVTKGRVSQWVSQGVLEGCYTGAGRARRFDLEKVAESLGRKLDKGQMLGNGLKTRRAIREVTAGEAEKKPAEPGKPARKDGPLGEGDPDRMELAKIQIAEENLRKVRRDNEAAEGHYVLASEVERQTRQILAQEIAEVENVLRDGAREIADRLGVDFKSARKILIDRWRDHRRTRTEALQAAADAADLTDAERKADI
ncbi:hypothetical protein OEW28_18690 [Defluviimonas sp. WL0002]|uniref:Helix-turn-helix domain-containing protein n=1 Tax=Albidovulum marisflavi TaxID=2984159 RepID=A0ABT2ZHM9_9RHOB|nr:hypothetical protein [Defluviimonas sp. WL0002]MCV2870645.1 hypothetical protein [Defluviimonas sp. WL0002]